MFHWLPYPLIRILIFFIVGIVCGIYVPVEFSPRQSCLITGFFFIGFIVTSVFRKKNYFLAGVFGTLLISIIGFIHIKHKLPVAPPSDLSYFIAEISGYPEPKEKSIKYEAALLKGSKDGESWKALDDQVLLYISKDVPLEYGDVIMVKSGIYEIKPPRNPEEFDYRKYLYFQGIRGQAFISHDKIVRINKGSGNTVIALAFKIRAWVDDSIDQYFDSESGSILKALLVGIRGDMDDELKTAYAAAGAVHVLAVSGLHVGIFYGLILWSFGWLKNTRKGKISFAVVALTALWFYAFVTGLSPSILRAVLMFSFIIVAQASNRSSGIYNAIAGSAFLLLCIDPLLLMNVGFQLSYLAVIGIVYLYPRLVGLWEFKNLYVDRIWQMSVVGIAAQIGTFPVTLFYFHQFPTYFLLSNLVVIPAATVILCSGMGFLALQWLPAAAGMVATLTEWVINIMNYSVRLISGLPYSTISEMYLSHLQLGLMVACVLFFIAVFAGRNLRYAYAFYLTAGVFTISKISEEYTVANDSYLRVYSIDRSTNIDFYEGAQLFAYSTAARGENEFFLKDSRKKSHAVQNEFPEGLKAVIGGNEVLMWKGKRMVILRDEMAGKEILEGIAYLLIENNAIKDFDILKDVQNVKVLLGTTNSYSYRNKILQFSEEIGLDIIDLNEGSFETEL